MTLKTGLNWLRGLSRSLKLMPFKSLCAVSYSPSIVTMAVSAAILEIFNVKEWPDLEIWICGPSRSLKKTLFDRPCMTFYYFLLGHSRSLKLMPFKSLGVVSYSPSIVTMTVSAVILEIFSVKEYRVRVHSRSLEMAPFDRSRMNSYSPSIATMAISCIVCEI